MPCCGPKQHPASDALPQLKYPQSSGANSNDPASQATFRAASDVLAPAPAGQPAPAPAQPGLTAPGARTFVAHAAASIQSAIIGCPTSPKQMFGQVAP